MKIKGITITQDDDMVTIEGKTIHFGAKGMSDYTIHKDKERKADQGCSMASEKRIATRNRSPVALFVHRARPDFHRNPVENSSRAISFRFSAEPRRSPGGSSESYRRAVGEKTRTPPIRPLERTEET